MTEYPMNVHQLEAQRLYALGVMYLANGKYDIAADAFQGAAKQLDELSEGTVDETRAIYRNWMFETIKFVKILEVKAKAMAEKSNRGTAPIKSTVGDSDEHMISFEMTEVPQIGFDSIAGLEDVKKAVRIKAIYPYQYPDMYQLLHKKTGGGILLYGLPGTGKTMIARAIAHETNAKFYPVRGSDFGSKWFGETEKNIRRLFEEAGKQERAVIFFDEIESYTNRSGNDVIMGRVVSELLSQMQGINRDGSDRHILFIAATNRPWAIDGAFMRPGRFDELIYVPLPDKESRKQIIENNFKNVPVTSTFDYEIIAERTDGFNGADVEHLCEKTKEIVINKSINQHKKACISMDDIEEALREVQSSVTENDTIQMARWLNNLGGIR